MVDDLKSARAKRVKREAEKKAKQANKATRKTQEQTPRQQKTTKSSNLTTSKPTQSNLASGAFTAESLSSLIPTFTPEQFSISDPLNPSGLPQISEARHEELKRIYDEGIYAVKVHGYAQDYGAEVVNTVGKAAKFRANSYAAAKQFELSEANRYSYLSQVEATAREARNYQISQAQTTANEQIAASTEQELAEKVEIAEIKVQLARTNKQKLLDKLNQEQQRIDLPA